MFIDASALVAIIANEADAPDLAERLLFADRRLSSGMAIWESTVALARITGVGPSVALREIEAFLARLAVSTVPIGAEEARIALEAHARFGKGRHPAKLNMGDCFAYACARNNGVALLYKGDDFALTDVNAG